MARRRGVPSGTELLLAAMAVLLTLALVEVGLRIARGRLLEGPERPSTAFQMVRSRYPGSYDALLGYVPTPNTSGRDNPWRTRVTITGDGVRSNGEASPDGVPILAVGDSMTFGDEVDDDQTWPAHLERILGRPVLNGGVFGYGLDQMVLRAEQLLERFPAADLLLLSLIPEDVLRCENAYRYAWKPYFDVVEGRLALRNVPVPPPEARRAGEPLWARWLHGSHLADLVMRRVDSEGWLIPERIRVHRRGVTVSRLLVDRLLTLTEQHGMDLLLVLQWIPSSSDAPARPVLAHARQRGVAVLELQPLHEREIEAGRIRLGRLYRMRAVEGAPPRPGHMSGEGNREVARLIAEKLAALGWVTPASHPGSGRPGGSGSVSGTPAPRPSPRSPAA